MSEGRLGVVDSLSVCRGLSPPAEKRGQRVGLIEDDPTDPVYDRLFKIRKVSDIILPAHGKSPWESVSLMAFQI